MRGAGVSAVIVAGGPDFVDHVGTRLIGGGVKIVLETARFPAAGTDESAKFGLQEEVLTFLGAQSGDEGDGAFGKLGDFCGVRVTAGRTVPG